MDELLSNKKIEGLGGIGPNKKRIGTEAMKGDIMYIAYVHKYRCSSVAIMQSLILLAGSQRRDGTKNTVSRLFLTCHSVGTDFRIPLAKFCP